MVGLDPLLRIQHAAKHYSFQFGDDLEMPQALVEKGFVEVIADCYFDLQNWPHQNLLRILWTMKSLSVCACCRRWYFWVILDETRQLTRLKKRVVL